MVREYIQAVVGGKDEFLAGWVVPWRAPLVRSVSRGDALVASVA
jgi:hypothetical protein